MNDHSDNHREVRLMRELVDELRAEQTPALDWDRVEHQLSARIGELAQARQRHPLDRWQRAGFVRLLGFAAAAAVVGLLVNAGGWRAPTATHAVAADSQPAALVAPQAAVVRPTTAASTDAAELAPGTILESGDGAARFVLAGVVDWTLAPHSRAVVRSTEVPYVLSLEQGSVRAEVVPHHADQGLVEAFAVESGGTRVAVHGTVFSVSREGDSVTVEVTRGSVTVGPAGHHGLTTGSVLVAPASAQFSLDWGRFARLLPPPALLASAEGTLRADGLPGTQSAERAAAARADGGLGGEAAPATPAGHGAGASSPGGRSTEPALGGGDAEARAAAAGTPSEQPATIELEQARAQMQACLGTRPTIDGETTLKLTISSHVTLHLEADGRVSAVQYAPALNPDLQQRCAAVVLGRRIAGATGTVGFSVQGSSD